MTTPDDCVRALRRAAADLDESPTKAQYEKLGLTPASATIQRVMGSWNAAKEEAGLATNASRGSRVQSKPDDVRLPEGLTWADLSQDQRWHYKNREWNGRRTLDRRARHRAWVHERKRDSDGCTRCDETDPACLDYHHRDEADKEMTVSEMVTHGYSKAKLRAEMAKCDILCANCHRKEHYEIPPHVRSLEPTSLDADG
ncbi:homing endonuclease associated repeat-containing protein [Haloarcula amylovorans]|uniref:homing endonuclease associated repeat-containing protein n=1 Tax=Haloarcula amylovorans TaxID=2562280 RepID=UPI001075EA41|nr:HNH endonuclease [Halomicroarcula amylolytica]